MVEGGASVISSFLKSGLVDSFLLTVAPVYVGRNGISAVQDAEVTVGRTYRLFPGRMESIPIGECINHATYMTL